jgi:HSP20 family molecular chaperone IbpA
MAPHEKRDFERTERTDAARFFVPYTDIHETDGAVIVSLEVPGVDKGAVDIEVADEVLTVRGKIDASGYAALRPIYREYDAGSFVRSFRVSPKIDATAISATMADGVLMINLPKAKEELLRRIAVN